MYFLLLLLLGQSKLYCFYFSEFEVIFITYLYGQFLLLLKEISSKTYSLLWETFFFFCLNSFQNSLLILGIQKILSISRCWPFIITMLATKEAILICRFRFLLQEFFLCYIYNYAYYSCFQVHLRKSFPPFSSQYY